MRLRKLHESFKKMAIKFIGNNKKVENYREVVSGLLHNLPQENTKRYIMLSYFIKSKKKNPQ